MLARSVIGLPFDQKMLSTTVIGGAPRPKRPPPTGFRAMMFLRIAIGHAYAAIPSLLAAAFAPVPVGVLPSSPCVSRIQIPPPVSPVCGIAWAVLFR
jgi:hypothetical protein